jgi:hypothetical protein
VCDATACLWAACDFGAAPPDDACSGALLDVSAGGRFAGSTCAANNDYTYSCGPTLAASGDVVFQLVLPGTRDVVIGTEGSDFDAVLFIRRGATCPGGTAERCDDNAAGGGQARITWTGMPAGTYWVILDGAGSGSYGNYVLNVWVSAAPPPANDTCGTAIVMRDSGTFAGTTLGATDDNAASCAPGTGGRDVWYSFTLGGRELVYLDLVDGNSWNSVLEVRRGSCPAPATVAACNDDACGGQRSQWFGPLDSGTTYYVVVDGAGASASGNFSLFFQHAPCAGATLLPASGDYDGSTAGAANDHAGGCGGRTAGEDDYYFGLCGSRTVAATTCNSASDFDTVLYLRQGSCFAGDLACNNDADPACVVSDTLSAVSATMGKGLGFLMVDGYYGDEGDYRVTVSGL